MSSVAFWSLGNVALMLSAYLLGSIPTGYLLGKTLKGIDIRAHGSGSTGATNVLRTLGKGPGIAVLLIDVLKGAGAIALTQFAYKASPLIAWGPSSLEPAQWSAQWSAQWFPWMVVLSGLMAILGHSKSVWLNFSGGKSVATSLGILLMLNWQVGLITFGVFGLMLALSRIVSLSSIAGAIALPFLMFFLKQPLAYLLFAVAGGVYVVLRHRTNIQRILAGTEPRLGEKSAAPANSMESV